MLKNLFYTGGLLDRAAEFRRDPAWLSERLGDPTSRFVPVWRDRNLVREGAGSDPLFLSSESVRGLPDTGSAPVFLGLEAGVAYFALDLSALEEAPPVAEAAFVDLRQAGPLMGQAHGSILAYARGLLYWHRNNGFCAVCGSPTTPTGGGHVRSCTGASCGREHFPRTDPAVIMLVVKPGPDGGSALLSRQSKWPEGMYSVLAGFVEPGESLEEAVAREVLEETGVSVIDARYRASQPWPFPASLMLGFRAVATTEDIRLGDGELVDAGWYTKEEVRAFTDNPRLPRPDSIARRLIAEWLAET